MLTVRSGILAQQEHHSQARLELSADPELQGRGVSCCVRSSLHAPVSLKHVASQKADALPAVTLEVPSLCRHILHRDIRPEKVMLAADLCPVLMDLGAV